MAFGCTVTVQIGQMPSSQSGFAWLLTEDNFPTAAVDGGASSIDNGGGNLRCYTDSTKATALPIEVVSFVTGGTPSCIVWGRSPNLGVGDTVYVEADDVETSQPIVTDPLGRNAVWQDFELIVHQGSIIDSTGNHNPSLNGSPPLVSALWGGNAYDFGDLNRSIEIPYSASLEITGPYSILSWKNNVNISTRAQVIYDHGDATTGTLFAPEVAGAGLLRNRGLTSEDLNFSLSTGLSFEVGTYDGVDREYYKNGVLGSSDTPSGTPIANTGNVFLYNTDVGGAFLEGWGGELWMKKSHTTQDGVSSLYNNQNDPVSFWSTGPWEDQDGGITVTVTELLSAISESSSVEINYNVSANVTENLTPILESSSLNVSEFIEVEVNVTETLNSFIDNSVVTVSAIQQINVQVTESLNSLTETSIVSFDISALVTENLNPITELSSVQLPTNWNIKPPVSTIWDIQADTVTDWTAKSKVTTTWIKKG